ncbi:MAG: Ldh family oxidoreductase [Spirochaetota bacterium]|nr:MAG: Ldh family oxidoreductase [Spirochaetota bacterium]
MKEEIVWIDFSTMENFMTDIFTRLGVPKVDARICADVLITADKRGIYSHGVNRLKQIYYDRLRQGIQHPVTRFDVVKRGPTTAVIDGHDGMGMVISKRAMEIAISCAKEFGMGMVVVRNSTHFGIAGYYAMMAADEGMIGITGTNARPSVAPTFGVENMLGTNPLTFAIPTDEGFPFVLDCATSVSQRGKIEAYDKLEKSLPAGWVIDEDGKPKTDPRTVLEELKKGTCALTPLGGIGEEGAGYKGYGYSTVVEILSAALQSGSYLKLLSGMKNGKPCPYRIGHFFITINISSFVELDEFTHTVGDILRALRASKKMKGQDRIYTAGEKEYYHWLSHREKGVPLSPRLQQDVIQMRDELELDQYEFEF